MKKAIITSLTDDRPGVLAAISSSLFKSDCNVLQVSQTALGSQFACIFIVTVPDNLQESQLRDDLEKNLAGQNISLQVKPMPQSADVQEETACDPFVVTTFGPDRKGLVAAVTRVIASHDSNVTNMRALFRGGDDPKDNLMVYEIDIPKSANLKALSDELRGVGEELSLEINIQHKNIFNKITKI